MKNNVYKFLSITFAMASVGFFGFQTGRQNAYEMDQQVVMHSIYQSNYSVCKQVNTKELNNVQRNKQCEVLAKRAVKELITSKTEQGEVVYHSKNFENFAKRYLGENKEKLPLTPMI